MISSLLALALVQSAPVATKADNDGNKVVCRNELELGSRIARRVCRTKQELDQMARDAQEDLRKSDNQRHLVKN